MHKTSIRDFMVILLITVSMPLMYRWMVWGPTTPQSSLRTAPQMKRQLKTNDFWSFFPFMCYPFFSFDEVPCSEQPCSHNTLPTDLPVPAGSRRFHTTQGVAWPARYPHLYTAGVPLEAYGRCKKISSFCFGSAANVLSQSHVHR